MSGVGCWRPQLFELAADPVNLPLDVHCREGKDRCGTMSALLLLALGVPEADVVKDYVLSNALLHRRIVARMFAIRVLWILVGAWDSVLYDSEALAMIMVVYAPWLESAIEQVRKLSFSLPFHGRLGKHAFAQSKAFMPSSVPRPVCSNHNQ